MVKEDTTPRGRKQFQCSKCGSEKVVPIVYGLPGPELEREWEKGAVELGGCIIRDNNPQYYCKDCEYRW